MGEIVTIADIRKTGHCARGIRRWFDGHGLDFQAFLKNGIEADVLLGTGDALAEQVVSAIRQKRDSDG